MKLLLLFLTSLFPLSLSSQHFLSPTNLPRPGDRLLKQQVVYVSPGDSTRQALWDFRELTPVDDHYELRYLSLNPSSDTIVGIEHRTMYYYHFRGDTLFTSGFENPTTLARLDHPEALLVFPFNYGRSLAGYFDGTGRYCDRLNVRMQGKTFVRADAEGSLILPGGDTLRHVLRVHTQKRMVERMRPIFLADSLPTDTLPFVLNRDSIEWHLKNDSIHTQMDTWRWYAEGYRYPVFESIESNIYKDGKKYPYFTTSFYYPPHEQYYGLESDPENQEMLDSADAQENNAPQRAPGQKSPQAKEDPAQAAAPIQECNLQPEGENNLKVTYTLNQPCEVFITLFDPQGRQLSATQRRCSTGQYSELFSLSGQPRGEYLVRIVAGEKIYAEKFILQ